MSGLAIVTGPACEPVTLVEAKDYVRYTDTASDGLIAGFLIAARQHIENYLGRALIATTFDFSLDYRWPHYCGFGYEIRLPKPAISVTSISYVDTTGAVQTLSSSAYQLTKRNGASIIVPAFGQAWPALRCQPDNITVRFVAGFGAQPSAVPEPIRQAIFLYSAHFDANREPVVVGTTAVILPLSVQALLTPYLAEF